MDGERTDRWTERSGVPINHSTKRHTMEVFKLKRNGERENNPEEPDSR